MTEIELRAAIQDLELLENGYPKGWAKKHIYQMTLKEKSIYKKWSALVSQLAELITPIHEGGTSQHHRRLLLHRPELSAGVNMTDRFMGGIPEHSVRLRGME